jgi:hypothetical protein
MPLPEIEQQMTTFVVRRFIEGNTPTERKEIVLKFRPHGTDAIHRLVTVNVLRSLDSGMLIPNVVAFSLCGRRESQLQAKSSFEMVVPVLQKLYETTPDSIVLKTSILESEMKRREPGVSPSVMRLGLYQCFEMGLVGGWSWEKQESEVQALRINERIMEIDVPTQWEKYIQKQISAVELFFREYRSREFLQGMFDLSEGREGIGITPMQWVQLATNLGMSQDDRNWVVRYLEGEGFVRKKPAASDILALTQNGIAELQGLNGPFTLTESATMPSTSETQNADLPELLVLISHSSKDKVVAESLIELLRFGLQLAATQIRCSSVDGYRLPAGVNTHDQLRREVKSAKVLIGLLTPNSLNSTYVLFELGARWGAGLPMIPLLAGIKPTEMRGPDAVLNALSCETEGQLIQLVEDIGTQLGLRAQSTASYLKQVKALMALSESPQNARTNQSSKPESLVFEETVYWKLEDGQREGPYCPVCFDERQKTIHLNPGATKGTYGCGICRNSFRTAEHENRGAVRRRPYSSR